MFGFRLGPVSRLYDLPDPERSLKAQPSSLQTGDENDVRRLSRVGRRIRSPRAAATPQPGWHYALCRNAMANIKVNPETWVQSCEP